MPSTAAKRAKVRPRQAELGWDSSLITVVVLTPARLANPS